MLQIGYLRLKDADGPDLKAAGCHVVRAEAGDEPVVLDSILDFISAGDELVVARLEHLAPTSRGLLEILDALEARRATLRVLDPDLSTAGPAGPTLRAVLEALARLEPPPRNRRRAAAITEIRALQRAGVGPVEIARRLGVSRMTVWRKLKALDAA